MSVYMICVPLGKGVLDSLELWVLGTCAIWQNSEHSQPPEPSLQAQNLGFYTDSHQMKISNSIYLFFFLSILRFPRQLSVPLDLF